MALDASKDGYVLRYSHSLNDFYLAAPPAAGPITLGLSSFHSALTPSGTFVTASWSPAANSLLLCAIGNRSSNTPSGVVTGVTGNGLTWTKAVERDDNQNVIHCQLWYAIGTPSAGAVTVSLSAVPTNIGVHLVSFTNVKLSGPIGNTASADTGATDTTSATLNINTSANNSVVFAFLINRNQTITIPGGSLFSSILTNQTVDSGGNTNKTGSYYSSAIATSGTTVSPTFTLSSAGDWAMVAAELKKA